MLSEGPSIEELSVSGSEELEEEEVEVGKREAIVALSVSANDDTDLSEIESFPLSLSPGGTYHIGRKDRLWLHISRMARSFPEEYASIMPKTYIVPREGKRLKMRMKSLSGSGVKQRFIVKPPSSARGTGVRLIRKYSQITSLHHPCIAQEYIERPYLIQGFKFDLRIYVYIPSFSPLRVYMMEDGLVRFASQEYSYAFSSSSNKYMHLTNFSLNKLVAPEGSGDPTLKWTLKELWRYLKGEGHNVRPIMERIVDVILKAIIACEGHINGVIKVHGHGSTATCMSCHELFGFDILLDEQFKPWLLEVNISPSLHSTTELDRALKSRLACDVLNLSRMTLPDKSVLQTSGPRMPPSSAHESLKPPQKDYCMDPRCILSEPNKDEKLKQAYYVAKFKLEGTTDPSILSCLTPNDIRVLIATEDEWDRRGSFTRLFPSPFSTNHLKFFTCPHYYDLLLNQWVAQYHHIRDVGCSYLKSVCEKKIHLERECTGKHLDYVWTNWKTKSCKMVT